MEIGKRNWEIGKKASHSFGFLLSALCVLLASRAFAFHEAGVAHCDVCHTMHASENGNPEVVTGPELLKFGTASDACLSCHATDLGAVWGTDPLHPPAEKGAGNFAFLSAANLNDGPNGATLPISGSHAGHNVISQMGGMAADPLYLTAPGGSYPSGALGCTSCHNPHGNGNYRMLYGAGHVAAGDFQFVNPAPQAAGIPLTGTESATSHAAYRSGMSAWCGNCHGTYHQNGVGSFPHPSDQTLGRDVATAYNQYAGSANPAGGNAATAYLPAVPFEDAAASTGSTAGPSLASHISCISCHRAHGSSAPYAGRWDINVVHPRDDGVVSGTWPIANPYASASQKSLCCKCHSYGEQHGNEQSCISCHMSPVSNRAKKLR
jgi:hypothetical protein